MKAVVKSWNDGAAQHAAAAVERHRLAFAEAKDELCSSQLSVKPLAGRSAPARVAQPALGPHLDREEVGPRGQRKMP